MSSEILGLIQLGTLLVAIFLGFPIAFTLIILAIVFGYIGFGPMVFDLMVIQAFGFMQEEVLAAVPNGSRIDAAHGIEVLLPVEIPDQRVLAVTMTLGPDSSTSCIGITWCHTWSRSALMVSSLLNVR